MKESILPLVLFFSIALNAAATTTLGVIWWQQRDTEPEVSLEEKPPEEFLRQTMGIELNKNQINQLSGVMEANRSQFGKLREQIVAKRLELVNLLAQPTPNRQMIREKIQDIASLQAEMECLATERLQAFIQTLPPSQRDNFLQLLRYRASTGRMGREAWRAGHPGRGRWRQYRGYQFPEETLPTQRGIEQK